VALASWLDRGELPVADPVADIPLAHPEGFSGFGNLQERGVSLCHMHQIVPPASVGIDARLMPAKVARFKS
jgi:hypothetical protein